MHFDYYYGSQADLFTFIRIPKLLIKDPIFKKLSIESKFIYGVLLDRMGLSIKNRWVDDDNRVYIIYQVSEMVDDIGFSEKTTIKLLKELENFGLIAKKRRGLGLPSLIYVKNFVAENENKIFPDVEDTLTDESAYSSRTVKITVQEKPAKIEGFEEVKNLQLQNCKNYSSRTVKNTPLKNNTNNSNTNIYQQHNNINIPDMPIVVDEEISLDQLANEVIEMADNKITKLSALSILKESQDLKLIKHYLDMANQNNALNIVGYVISAIRNNYDGNIVKAEGTKNPNTSFNNFDERHYSTNDIEKMVRLKQQRLSKTTFHDYSQRSYSKDDFDENLRITKEEQSKYNTDEIEAMLKAKKIEQIRLLEN